MPPRVIPPARTGAAGSSAGCIGYELTPPARVDAACDSAGCIGNEPIPEPMTPCIGATGASTGCIGNEPMPGPAPARRGAACGSVAGIVNAPMPEPMPPPAAMPTPAPAPPLLPLLPCMFNAARGETICAGGMGWNRPGLWGMGCCSGGSGERQGLGSSLGWPHSAGSWCTEAPGIGIGSSSTWDGSLPRNVDPPPPMSGSNGGKLELPVAPCGCDGAAPSGEPDPPLPERRAWPDGGAGADRSLVNF
mmetsp:Transcript_922/g.2103  ORF Transcript_922/g.2103 Transcript_922/m.2103 type:complete len:248 (-) Transcript_922:745-1488(-)